MAESPTSTEPYLRTPAAQELYRKLQDLDDLVAGPDSPKLLLSLADSCNSLDLGVLHNFIHQTTLTTMQTEIDVLVNVANRYDEKARAEASPEDAETFRKGAAKHREIAQHVIGLTDLFRRARDVPMSAVELADPQTLRYAVDYLWKFEKKVREYRMLLSRL